MAVRPPQSLTGGYRFETGDSILDAELAGEKAHALGRMGRAAEAALARLNDPEAVEAEGREALLKAAAQAVWAWFIQRESCGLRDHKAIIRDFGIPRAVLVRLGAR
jgi:hypothetical protein